MKKFFKLNLQLFAEGEGDEGTSTTTGGDSGTGIDYARIESIVNKRTANTADSVLKGVLKQYGLTGEELEQAVSSFKQQKAAAEAQKDADYANATSRVKELEAQILNSNIDKTLTTLASTEGVSVDKIPFLLKLVERKDIADDKGNIVEDKAKEALKAVLTAFPDFKGTTQQQNNGFQQIGGAGSQGATSEVDAALDAIFGIKKK